MNKIRGKIGSFHLPAIVVILAILLGFCVVQKIYFKILFHNKISPQVIEEIFENNFKKAIQFGDSHISLGGNIILKNVKIAPTTDFNDNYNLISCKEAIIDLNYFKAFTGTIAIKGIIFNDASITIVKNYGKSYQDTFKSIFAGIIHGNSFTIDNFYLEATGDLQYNESFTTDKLRINVHDLSVYIHLKDKKLSYDIKGSVAPLDSTLDSGKLHISGTINYNNMMNYKSSHHAIYAKKIDMHIANYFLREYSDLPVVVRGYFYTDCTIDHDSKYKFDGTIEFDNCTVLYIKNTPHYEIISKDNISVDARVEFTHDLSDIVVSSFSFDDKEISFDFTLKYFKDTLLQFYISTNNIDLEDCDYIQFVPGVSYQGLLNLQAKCDFDIAHNNMQYFKIICDARDVSLSRRINNITYSYINDTKLHIEGDVKKIVVDFFTKHKDSDILLYSTINIDRWLPFSSVTDINITSKKLYTQLLSDVIVTGLSSLYAGAMKDMGMGYNEIFFRDKPLGVFLINNIIKIKINVARLIFDTNAYLKNLNIDIVSNKGAISTPSFRCEGYSGIFSFSVNAFCNCDYPTMSVNAAVSNFDYGKFLIDSGKKNATGVLNATLSYSVSGYRLSHLLQNGNGLLQVTIANTIFDKTLLQKKIGEIAKNCNVSFPDGIWRCNRLDITVNHTADRWIVQNIFIDTDMVQIGGYGNYTLDKGLQLPCSATLFIKEGAALKSSQRINFTVLGNLDNPVILTTAPCNKKSISIFDVN
ncbi:MAG: hypothetical protein N3F66_12375 [Spirochaetes bacterium]|nr:hypothetical protein [Spirochaetota bacterium]